MALQHLINHVALVVDRSGSMQTHAKKVVEVFDRELNALKQRSVDAHQETRISIYLFDDTVECLTFDMDVMRFTSLKDYYRIGGMTALLDASNQAIKDHQKLPELYGDHAFLLYVITDGQENRSKTVRPDQLRAILEKLPDNWTSAILVPDNQGARYAEQCGFNTGSVSIWNTSKANALDDVGTQFNSVMTNYMTMRSTGVRGTKNLFDLDPSKVSVSNKQLSEVDPKYYEILPVRQDSPIKEYVESWTKDRYRLGSTYYQPTKPVKLQDYKKILMQDTKSGRVYEGHNMRQLLGLPSGDIEVNPLNHPDWRMFLQSTSTNRKLFAGTFILVRK